MPSTLTSAPGTVVPAFLWVVLVGWRGDSRVGLTWSMQTAARLGPVRLQKLYERFHEHAHQEAGQCCHDRPAQLKAEILRRAASKEKQTGKPIGAR